MSVTETYPRTVTTGERRARAVAEEGAAAGVSGRSPAPAPARPRGIDALGGKRGLVDGGLPPFVFVVNAVAGAQTTAPRP
ncbi:MAG TPA: hypothetical protein VHF92_18665 [Geodermatophilus sp.]|nr:hypothetical protein [Geodermatophilus sp.]